MIAISMYILLVIQVCVFVSLYRKSSALPDICYQSLKSVQVECLSLGRSSHCVGHVELLEYVISSTSLGTILHAIILEYLWLCRDKMSIQNFYKSFPMRLDWRC